MSVESTDLNNTLSRTYSKISLANDASIEVVPTMKNLFLDIKTTHSNIENFRSYFGSTEGFVRLTLAEIHELIEVLENAREELKKGRGMVE